MLRNRRGATSLRWLRALLDHGVEVHGQVVCCPGRQRRRGARRHPGRGARPLPGAGQPVRRAARREPAQPGARDAAPHRRRGGRGARHRARLAGRVPAGARPAARVRGRRVLPAGRPAVPLSRGVRGLPDARGRHRHGPHLRARVHGPDDGPDADRPAGAGSSPGPTASRVRGGRRLRRPAEGYRAVRTLDATGPRLAAGPARARAAPGRRSSPAPTARGCSRRWSTGSAATTCGCVPVENRFFGGNVGVTG